MKTGAIYAIRYSFWRTNPTRIYCFVLHKGVSKLHCLQIGVIQMNTFQRAKIINIIRKLSQAPAATHWNGLILYRIFRRYAPQEVRLCYRTFWSHGISATALINYGLNKKEDFSELELKNMNQDLYKKAKQDFIVKTMNLVTGKGTVDLGFATPTHPTAGQLPTNPGADISPPSDDPGGNSYF